MLKGIKIIDFTHRLPGPLAGKILTDLGAEVIKVEDIKHKDPFLSGMFSVFDASFEDWYEELNKGKKIIRLDFKATDIKEQIKEILPNACCEVFSTTLPVTFTFAEPGFCANSCALIRNKVAKNVNLDKFINEFFIK